MLVWGSFTDLLKSANKVRIYFFVDFLLKKTGHVCGQEKRADRVITVCEIKHHNKKIGTHIIPEMERKCALVNVPRGSAVEKALISLYGPENSLKDAGYFHHFVTLDDILSPI